MLASQLLLVLALAAVAGASLRIASLTCARGLELALAAIAIGATIVVLETLALGLAGAGGEPAALGSAAAATWLASLAVRRRGPPFATGLLGRALALGTGQRVLAGALAGLALTWVAWLLREPFIGFDGLTYHLGMVIAWIGNNRPGSQVPLFQGLPIENYPLTTEVLLTWPCALARSYAPAVAAMAGFLALAGAGGWSLLRRLGVDRLAAALAVAALLAVPYVAGSTNFVNTDVPALAWLLCAAALAAGARARPALLAPALLAAGLCLGSKTTPALMLVAVLAAGGWAGRASLRRLRAPIAAAGAAAAVVGGLWYVRNLLQHGSPLWPFVALPGGDPIPRALRGAVHTSFLSHPLEMLRANREAYLQVVAGGVLLLGAIVAAPLLARRRRVLAVAALTAVGLLAWMNAPYTGIPRSDERVVGVTRYLLATYAAGAVTLALAATDGTRVGRRIALALLAASAAWSALRLHFTGFPVVASSTTIVLGAVAGGAGALGLAAGAKALRRRWPARRLATPALAVVLGAVAVAVAGLSAGASGLTLRHARTGAFDAGLVRFLEANRDSGRPVVWISPAIVALVAGDGLERRVGWFGFGTPCASERAHLAEGWVAVVPKLRKRTSACLHAAPLYVDAHFVVYGA